MNQVVEIMLNYLELRDWKQALLKVIPTRKRGPEDGGGRNCGSRQNHLRSDDSATEERGTSGAALDLHIV